MFREVFRKVARAVPLLGNALTSRDSAIDALNSIRSQVGWPPGHYYSPIPSSADLEGVRSPNNTTCDAPAGIDLNLETQKNWLDRVKFWYPSLPFFENPTENLRYYLKNPAFVYSDGIVLYSMMRELQPKRIVEVGSGFSSAVMLDTSDLFFNGEIELTFIEPYPDERLTPLLKSSDASKCRILRENIQAVKDCPWETLRKNDILFIDSSHVSKYRSDVNQLFFEVLPTLASGVVVHVHDVFPGFEYPLEWLKRGWYWNEAYLLRAFLMFNKEFEILLWPSLMLDSNTGAEMPLCLKNTGSSFWMRRR